MLTLRELAVCRGSVLLWVLCCCGCCAACASRVSNLNISGSTMRILPMLAVYVAVVRRFCIADRYQVPSIRYQVFDTTHTHSISAYTLRLLPVVVIEYFIQMMRVYWCSTRNASCTRSNLGGYCKLTCYLQRCCYRLCAASVVLLLVLWLRLHAVLLCCGAASSAAIAFM